jgi:alpha-tubulin suppressor-like RCC1 family protein
MKTHVMILSVLMGSTAGGIAANAPYGWGRNPVGNLGDGSTTNRSTPVATLVSGALAGKEIISVVTSAVARHTLAVSSDGKAYAWGEATLDQLGDGATAYSASSPVAVDMTGVLAGKSIVQVAAGFSHTLALTADGGLYAWGGNGYGELGDGTTTSSKVPVAVNVSGVLAGKTITQLSAGWYFSMALDSNGNLYAWGYNPFGQLGDGTTTDRTTAVIVDTSGVLSGKIVSRISAGANHCLALTTDGVIAAWGGGLRGQLGDAASINRSTPVAVDTSGALASKTITDISASYVHSMALASDGTTFTWGSDQFGSLGDSAAISHTNVPVAVDTSGVLFGKTVTQISAGLTNSYFLTSSGDLYACGETSSGDCGDGVTGSTPQYTPVAVDMTGVLSGLNIVSLSGGYGAAMVMAAPASTSITPSARFTYAANFSWLNWRWSTSSTSAPVIEPNVLHGRVYAADVGWLDLGDGTPTDLVRYSQTGGDVGVNHDGAGTLSGYAYGANIGWVKFDPTIAQPPRINLTSGDFSGYAYSANCGWIHLGTLKTTIHPGPDLDGPLGGGDHIADSWEIEKGQLAGFGNNLSLLGATPASDFDFDGFSDLEEYQADTNPFSATDRLQVTNFTYNPATGDIDIDWTGTPRRNYTIFYSSDLRSWQQAAPPLTGGTADFTLAGPALKRLFFRIGAGLPLQ